LIKLDQAAKILTVSRRTLDRLIAAGQLHRIQVSAGRYAIQEEEITKYITEQTTWESPTTKSANVISFESVDAGRQLRNRLLQKLKPKPS
ncbi:helix-turn-helix transcriptional regulator, partial [Enterococcus faecium]